MKKKLEALEATLDQQLESLSIWQASFQSILSTLLLIIDNVGRSKGADTAMDYLSRLSYLFNKIRDNAANHEVESSASAIMGLAEAHAVDITFLNAFAHFSMLMPQIHRGTIVPIKIDGNIYELDYASKEVEAAELMDKLYAAISLQVAVTYKKETDLYRFLYKKVTLNDSTFAHEDARWIKDMADYYKQFVFIIEVLPSVVLEQAIGLTYTEYVSLTAAIRAYAEYFLTLATAYLSQSNSATDPQTKDVLMVQYFENIVCCLNSNFVGFFMTISGLSKEKVLRGLSNYMTIYSNNTGENFVENAFCGDGFFPPICLIDKFIIFSPHSFLYMLNVNNALYSLNKMNQKHFNDNISHHLEPTLVNQLEYLFLNIPGLSTAKNVHYDKSEIDLLVLSEAEKICLVIQVKATIAPDSSRTVQNVQGRALEGIEKINLFNELSEDQKLVLINKEFNTTLTEVQTVDLLVVRSSAGSAKIWQHNERVRIANYAVLAWIISRMIEAKEHVIANFSDRIKATQDELVSLSQWKKEMQDLVIGDYTIKMPNLNINMDEILPINFRSYKNLPDMEKSHS